jgi:hypothetical protein
MNIGVTCRTLNGIRIGALASSCKASQCLLYFMFEVHERRTTTRTFIFDALVSI